MKCTFREQDSVVGVGICISKKGMYNERKGYGYMGIEYHVSSSALLFQFVDYLKG